MSERYRYPELPALATGLKCRCPRCGRGRLFDGLLSVKPACPACGLDNAVFDPGDGPAIFVILIAGALVVGGSLFIEFALHPPLWVQYLIWLPLGLILPLAMLRPFKGVLIALQYKHKAAEGRPSGAE